MQSSLAAYAMWTNPLVPGSLMQWISSICVNNSSACAIYPVMTELGICLNLCFLSFANYPKIHVHIMKVFYFLFMVLNSRFHVWNMWKGCTLLILFEREQMTHTPNTVYWNSIVLRGLQEKCHTRRRKCVSACRGYWSICNHNGVFMKWQHLTGRYIRVSLSEQMLQHHSHIHTYLYAVVFLAVKLIKMTSFLHNVMDHHHLSFSPCSSSFSLILCDSPDPLRHVLWWIVRKILTGSGLTSTATASVTHFLVCVCVCVCVLCTRLWCSVSHDYTQIMSPSLLCQFTHFFKLRKHLCGRSRNTHTYTCKYTFRETEERLPLPQSTIYDKRQKNKYKNVTRNN